MALRTFLAVLTILYSISGVSTYITYIAARLPLQGDHAKPGSPWPHPRYIQDSNTTLTLNPFSFEFTSDLSNCDILDHAFPRYTKLLTAGTRPVDENIAYDLKELQVKVNVQECEKYPYFEMDESYALKIDGKAVLTANNVWGVLRGLETFSQLIFKEDGQYQVRHTYISDSPRFPHRGTHVDTARHYIPMNILLRHLDTMEWNKFNVFHWHIIDDQSFPYVSIKFPELSKKAAFSSRHVYTQENVAEIIEYARLRGIRVIPEFDTPGHALGWGKAFPNLLTECWANDKPGVANYSDHAEYENLDPSNNETYVFLQQFFEEVKDVFKDNFLHMGMDEAHYMCWKSSPKITRFMQEMGIEGNYPLLEQYFSGRVLTMISEMKRRYIVWQDPTDHGAKLEPSAIVHIWKGGSITGGKHSLEWKAHLANVARMGYDIIFSSCWYLNYISYGEDWRYYYNCDPQHFNGTNEEKQKVKGGEAAMWAEYVDGTNFLSRYWPRASAVAERLWSPSTLTDLDTARWRLDQHRCRMVGRGIPAEPIHPGNCGDIDFNLREITDLDSKEVVCSGSDINRIVSCYTFVTFLFVYCLIK